MMDKFEFCNLATKLREYAQWDRKLYECGIDISYSPAGDLAEAVWEAMTDYNPNWSYDEKLQFDWIIEWVYSPDSPNLIQDRHNREFALTTPEALYEFILFMNKHGWED